MLVSIIADSINPVGNRLTTFVLHDFPKFLLAELNTHRVFSRNAASSRAIPIAKTIEQIKSNPFIPKFTAHQKGMQGGELSPNKIAISEKLWLQARDEALESAEALREMGVHKQNANRLLEPFMRVPVIVSATEWDNFFKLRCHPDAQPEFQEYAYEMQRLYLENSPRQLKSGEWHTPFYSHGLGKVWVKDEEELTGNLKIATARCARVSYRTHDGEHSIESDFRLHDQLLESAHMSPFEHCAMALSVDSPVRNFRGWQQYRVLVESRESVRCQKIF